MINNEEYNSLYDKYKSMTKEELEEIINSGDQYRDIAKHVAKDILNNIKTEYKNPNNDIREENPMQTYNMAKDIHFIKNAMMFFVILTIIALIGEIIGIIYFEKSVLDFINYMKDLSMYY